MAKQHESSGKSKKASTSRARPSGKGRPTRTGDAPGRGHVDSPEDAQRTKEAANPSSSGSKVGSSGKAAAHFAGKNDFGIPADKARPGQQTNVDGSIENRPDGTRIPTANPDGRRDVGVGGSGGGPGASSGGDLDQTFVGVGTHGTGVSSNPDRRTQGADIIEGVNDPKRYGGPSKGENQLPPGTHGTIGHFEGTVHDRMDREVHLGDPGNEDASVIDVDNSGLDRSGGEDVDDRETSTGAD